MFDTLIFTCNVFPLEVTMLFVENMFLYQLEFASRFYFHLNLFTYFLVFHLLDEVDLPEQHTV